MKKGNLRSSALLLLTACIWGVCCPERGDGVCRTVYLQLCEKYSGRAGADPVYFFPEAGKKGRGRKSQRRGKKSTAKNTAGRRDLLWCRPVPGKQFPADRHPIYNRRKSRFHYSVLYCDRSGDRTFYKRRNAVR